MDFVGNQPLTGSDFKLIYGNLDKSDYATLRAKFIYADAGQRAPIDDTFTVEVAGSDTCYYEAGNTFNINTLYRLTSGSGEYSQYKVLWKLISGDVELIGDTGSREVMISSKDIAGDNPFVLHCYINEEYLAAAELDFSGSHHALEFYVGDLTEIQHGECVYSGGNTCEATSKYKIDHLNGQEFVWTVSGATITDGQGTDTITITSDGTANTQFHVRCNVSAGNLIESKEGDYEHTRSGCADTAYVVVYDQTNIAKEFVA